jgi:hypothetical protein
VSPPVPLVGGVPFFWSLSPQAATSAQAVTAASVAERSIRSLHTMRVFI